MKQSKTEWLNILRTFLKKKKIVKKPVRVGNFCSNSYTKHESNVDRNNTLSLKEYLNKINHTWKKNDTKTNDSNSN